MKTIFKVDQKVYDQVNFPNSEGTVTEIERDVDGYWVCEGCLQRR